MKKLFRKIHLWLSLPFGLIISFICLTGAILVFETEIMELTYRSRYFVKEVKEQPLPLETLVERANKTLEDNQVTSVRISSDPKRNYSFGLQNGFRQALFVDQYSGEVIELYKPNETFFWKVRILHRWLMDPGRTTGKKIVGISTLIFVFILITGLVIWLPKKIKGIGKRFKIHVKSGWRRFWVDLHLVGGVYALLFLLLMALTGLTWSFPWYRSAVNSLFGVTATNTTQGNHHASAAQTSPAVNNEQRGDTTNANNSEVQPQRGERGNRGENGEGEERIGNRGNRENSESTGQREGRGNRGGGEGRGQRGNREGNQEEAQQQINFLSWEKALENIKEKYPKYNTINVQEGSASVSLSSLGNRRASDRYTFDARGNLIDYTPYSEQPKSARLHGWYYSLHVGTWGGMVTKILSFIAALIGTALPLTGYYIFIKKEMAKRKKKKLMKANV